MKRLLPIAIVFLATGYAWGEDSGALADRILKAASRPVGLVHLPRCGDGTLALALAKASPGLCVHGQDADGDRVKHAREAADQAGLLGRRVWIDQGNLERLLPVGRSCDLVVMTDLVAGDLTPALAAEIRRVLHPWYGLVVLGGAPGKLDPAALLAWARTIAPDTTPTSQESLVMVKAGPLPKADDWTHWWHGPDNNAVSTDAAYSLPETMQWTGKPYFAPTRVELPIVCGGRLFVLWNGNLLDMSAGKPSLSGVEGDGPLLTAQAVGSGQRLWACRLSPAAWLQVARSTLVADGADLLVADGSRILELEAATGQELRKIELDCAEIRWLAVADGKILVLGGPATENLGNRKDIQVVPFRSSGLLLAVLQRDTFKELWRVQREKGAEAFDPRSPAVSGDKVFVTTESGNAEAFALADGRPAWKSVSGVTRGPTNTYDWDRVSRHPLAGYALQGLYLVSGLEVNRLVALDQSGGGKQWEMPKRGAIPLATRDLVWLGGNGLDPLTGTSNTTIQAANGTCGRYTACPQGMVGGGLTWDWTTSQPYPLLSAKSSCGAGSYVANGLIWKFPTPCTNCTEWRGFMVRSAGEKPPALKTRLFSGLKATAGETTPVGWLTHRANGERSGATPAAIGKTAKILWSTPPVHPTGPVSSSGTVLFDSEIVPVPPVIAGPTAIVAGADGAVDALDLDTGKTRWRALTGGRIASSPSIWKDRVFVGSADGYLYALALADGRELWRLRVAPDAGEIMIYGQLASRWPVLSSPLVVNERVFATAGMLDGVDGVYAVLADANTGALLWECRDWSGAEVNGKISGAGQSCLEGTQVIYHGGENPPVAIALADGQCRSLLAVPSPEEIKKNKLGAWGIGAMTRGGKGQEVGSLGPDWLIYGGRRLFTDQSEDGAWGQGLSFLSRKQKGGLPLLRIEESALMPVWDQREMLFIFEVKRIDQLVLMPREKVERVLDSQLAGGQEKAASAKDSAYLRTAKLNADELVRWRYPSPYGTKVMGCALASNAAILLTAKPRGKTGSGELSAINRADGSKWWAIPLPEAPVHDGLAIAPDGRMVVVLRDGGVVCAESNP